MSNTLKTFPKFSTHLYHLELLIRDMKDLPDELFELENLQTLIIASKNLKHLSNKVGSLHNLRFLDISNTNIATLPDFLFTMPYLKKIIINDETNYIKSQVPDRVALMFDSKVVQWNENGYFYKLEFFNNKQDFREKEKIDTNYHH